MKPIALTDLVPRGATFKLASTDKEYRLRPVTLSDEKWMIETFGADLQDIFAKMKMLQVARIIFHQLEEQDKADFAQREVKIMNEEGVTITKKMGGAELLFWQIRGFDEKIELFKALMETIGVSRKMMDGFEAEAAAEAESDKKKVSQPTGQESSIASQPSTVGPLSIYGQEL